MPVGSALVCLGLVLFCLGCVVAGNAFILSGSFVSWGVSYNSFIFQAVL